MKSQTNTILDKAMKDSTLKGRQVIVIGGEIHALDNKKNARIELLLSLTKKYPGQTPTITLIPKENTLILLF